MTVCIGAGQRQLLSRADVHGSRLRRLRLGRKQTPTPNCWNGSLRPVAFRNLPFRSVQRSRHTDTDLHGGPLRAKRPHQLRHNSHFAMNDWKWTGSGKSGFGCQAGNPAVGMWYQSRSPRRGLHRLAVRRFISMKGARPANPQTRADAAVA